MVCTRYDEVLLWFLCILYIVFGRLIRTSYGRSALCSSSSRSDRSTISHIAEADGAPILLLPYARFSETVDYGGREENGYEFVAWVAATAGD